jgi:hypothetical protein
MRLGKRSIDDTLLMPAERFMLATTLVLAVVSVVVILLRGTPVEWQSYAFLFFSTGLLMLMGLYYRVSGRNSSIGNTLISAACFLTFSPVASAFTYQFLPLWRAPIDPWLVSMDAMLGFHWPDAMALAASYPLVGKVMWYVYLSWLPQYCLLIVALGLTGRTFELHAFMMATVIGTLITISVWALFPSFGTTTVFAISASIEEQLHPLAGSAYGELLRRVAVEGPLLISPKETVGLIATPSFHTVMAVVATLASRTLPWAWPWVLPLNLLVLPSTVIHGGHHLVDIFAGLAAAFVAAYAARAYLRSNPATHGAAMAAMH